MRLSIVLAAGRRRPHASRPRPPQAGQDGRRPARHKFKPTTISPPPSARSASAASKPMAADTQIACTHLGCNPIPRGCRIQTGRIPFTWDPSGFDEVVCPYRR